MKFYRWMSICVAFFLFTSPFFSIKAAAQAGIPWPTSISLILVESDLIRPVHITHASDGSGRLFVVEQDGRIQVLRNGNKLNIPFLDIRGRVRSPSDGPSNGERGLLSVAFPPGFGATKNYFYVYYTNNSGDNQVSRFYVSGNPDIADSSSEKLILLFPHPTYGNHNGGQIVFGPDGYLYIGTGDGGGGGDPFENAQNPASLLGKLLRIDVEPNIALSIDQPYKSYLPMIMTSTGPTYAIPPDNPFVGQPGYRPEIWVLGLRNPWRFSFDRNTGDLFIGDVGQNAWEEIDFQPAESPGGENYGWDNMEGEACYEPSSGCDQSGMTSPITVYGHDPECSVTGGFVYRGSTYPALQGIYVFGDYCSGRIWGLQPDNNDWLRQELKLTGYSITSFGEDEAGELYLTTTSGAVYQIVTP